MLPTVLTRAVLGPALQHAHSLVRHHALLLVLACSIRVIKAVTEANQWAHTHPTDATAVAEYVAALRDTLSKRLPGIEIFFALRHACDTSEGRIVEHALVLKILAALLDAMPDHFLAVKFDFGKLLVPRVGLLHLPSPLQHASLALLARAPAVKWESKAGDEGLSYFGFVLRLWAHSTIPCIRKACATLVTRILTTACLLTDHEAACWAACTPSLAVVTFLDAVFLRFSKDSFLFLDRCALSAREGSPSSPMFTTTLPFSPLLAALIDCMASVATENGDGSTEAIRKYCVALLSSIITVSVDAQPLRWLIRNTVSFTFDAEGLLHQLALFSLPSPVSVGTLGETINAEFFPFLLLQYSSDLHNTLHIMHLHRVIENQEIAHQRATLMSIIARIFALDINSPSLRIDLSVLCACLRQCWRGRFLLGWQSDMSLLLLPSGLFSKAFDYLEDIALTPAVFFICASLINLLRGVVTDSFSLVDQEEEDPSHAPVPSVDIDPIHTSFQSSPSSGYPQPTSSYRRGEGMETWLVQLKEHAGVRTVISRLLNVFLESLSDPVTFPPLCILIEKALPLCDSVALMQVSEAAVAVAEKNVEASQAHRKGQDILDRGQLLFYLLETAISQG